MCISAMIIGGLVSAIGSVFTGMAGAAAAQNQAQWARYQADVQNEQLRQERDLVKIEAMKVEGERQEAARRQRARNMAWLALGNVEDNQSFLQGADEYNKQAMRQDIATLRLNERAQIHRIASQIQLNNANASFQESQANIKATASIGGGIIGAIGSSFNALGKIDKWRH